MYALAYQKYLECFQSNGCLIVISACFKQGFYSYSIDKNKGFLKVRFVHSQKHLLFLLKFLQNNSWGKWLFNVCSLEILEIAGVSGNGQSELLEILSGMITLQTGEINIGGKAFDTQSKYNPNIARKTGIVHIPEDRMDTGMIKDFTAKENNFLGYQKFKQFFYKLFLQENNIEQDCIQNMKNFDVRPALPESKMSSFSGGNQQKLLLAREISKDAKILLIGQPTRGVDVGAIESIHKKLLEQKNQGKAILLVSAELDEILALSDRIMVMFQGKIVGECPKNEATHSKLGLMMTNSHKKTKASKK